MNILNLLVSFIALYWLDLLIVFFTIAVLLMFWKKGKKKQVLQVINYLVAEAEKELGSKTGKYKKGKVIEALYNKLPLVVTIFFTRKEIENFIDYYAAKLTIFLENEENNLEGYRNLTPVKTFYPLVDKIE